MSSLVGPCRWTTDNPTSLTFPCTRDGVGNRVDRHDETREYPTGVTKQLTTVWFEVRT
jgi:hypothetical protein